MSQVLDERQRQTLKRVLGEMESPSPIGPDLLSKPGGHRHGSRRPAPIVHALVGIVVVFVAALPVVLFAGGEEPASSPQRAVTTSKPVEPPAQSWTVTQMPVLGSQVAAVEAGFVAISGNSVWTSRNGASWEQSGELEVGASVQEVVHRDGSLVATGHLSNGPGDLTPAMWTSPDGGSTWSRTAEGMMVRHLAATPIGFLAAGFVTDDSSTSDNGPRHGALWSSPNGQSWEQVAEISDRDGMSSTLSAVQWNNGRLIVLGERGPTAPSEGAAGSTDPVWESVTWTAGTDLKLDDGTASELVGYIEAAEATPFGLMASTYWTTPASKDNSAAWVSPDGVRWTRLPFVEDGWEYSDVAASGGAVLVVGYSHGSNTTSAIWRTTDGTTWENLATPDMPTGVRLLHVDSSSNGLVVAGDNNGTVSIIAGKPSEPPD